MNDPNVRAKYKNLTAMTYESIKRNVMEVEVYYGDLQYTGLSEVEYISIMGFLSRIGRLFGLLLGMSILSFIQIFELIIVLNLFFIEKINNKFFK